MIVTPSFACRVTDLMVAEVRDVDSGLAMAWPRAPICQNLTEGSPDTEMREEGEENARV